MTQKIFCIEVRGKQQEWLFLFNGDDRYLKDWLDDGLNITEVVNTIPQWWVNLGLPVKLWCWAQDLFTRIGVV